MCALAWRCPLGLLFHVVLHFTLIYLSKATYFLFPPESRVPGPDGGEGPTQGPNRDIALITDTAS